MQRAAWVMWSSFALVAPASAQESPPTSGTLEAELPKAVEVAPQVRDEQIASRLTRVLEATGWFSGASARVDEGVVFLSGTARDDEAREWAVELARRTRDVVAVVDRMTVADPPMFEVAPLAAGLRRLWRDLWSAIPAVAFGLFVLGLSFGIAILVGRAVRATLRQRVVVPLLRRVMARTAAAVVLVLGVYLVLRTMGLTRLAVTVLGGTGLIGLVLGIAFRDITENFLASIFLSIQRPFLPGDLVEVDGITGYVQRLTVRTTILMNLDGNHVQIPNSTIYKSVVRNFTSNPNRREHIVVGIGYDVPITRAQEVALAILAEHPAVLAEPEPWVLVDSLGPAAVNLRVYFWLDGTQHSWLKVRSSVMRLIKRTFSAQGITMPDAEREIVFPRGVPVTMVTDAAAATPPSSPPREGSEVATEAEQGLHSEAPSIERQATGARQPEPGADLLLPS